MYKNISTLTLFAVISVLSGCATHMPSQNLGELKSDLIRYQGSAAYEQDFDNVMAQAHSYIVKTAPSVKRPAIILDIDETTLSNWPELKANDLTFKLPGPCLDLPKGPCGLDAWQLSRKAKTYPATLALFNAAQKSGVSIFFITGRDEKLRQATENNLHRQGYKNWTQLIMRPTGTSTPSAKDYKAPQRKIIEEQGYTVIANIGDQPSDLAGGYSQRNFLIPNPFYRIP